MKLTVRAAIEMLQAMGQLDSYQNGADKPTLYSYSGDTRLQIAMARRKLRTIQEDYTEARNALLTEITDGKGELSPEDREKMAWFLKGDKELLLAEIDLDIKPVPLACFKLDDNPIPAAVLDMLGDFIDLGEMAR